MRGGARRCLTTLTLIVEGGTTVPRTELGVCTTQLLGTVLLLHCLPGSNGEAPGQLQI